MNVYVPVQQEDEDNETKAAVQARWQGRVAIAARSPGRTKFSVKIDNNAARSMDGSYG
jgi:hypothetical protein